MYRWLIINTFALKIVGNRAEDVITPNRDVVFAVEGQKVTLSCNYSGTANSLHWYRQYSASPPQFLIMDYSGSTITATPPVPGILIEHVKKAMIEQRKSNESLPDVENYIYDQSISENIDEEMSVTAKIPMFNIRMHKEIRPNESKKNIPARTPGSSNNLRENLKNISNTTCVNKDNKHEKENNRINTRSDKENIDNKKPKTKNNSGQRFIDYVKASKKKQAKLKENLLKDWEAQHTFRPSINRK